MKLEKIRSIISGDEYVIPDFDIKPEEILNEIPSNPREGLMEIENSDWKKQMKQMFDIQDIIGKNKSRIKI